MTYSAMPDGQSVRRDGDGATFTPDPSSDLPVQRDYQAWLAAGNAPTPAPPPPTLPRRAALSDLFDALSADQRSKLTADHKDRLEAEAGEHPGGLLPITNSKVVRAAPDLGLTPDAWFKLAGY